MPTGSTTSSSPIVQQIHATMNERLDVLIIQIARTDIARLLNYIDDLERAAFAELSKRILSCSTCSFFSDGHCRRHAPAAKLLSRLHAIWPRVSKSAWCGDHSAWDET